MTNKYKITVYESCYHSEIKDVKRNIYFTEIIEDTLENVEKYCKYLEYTIHLEDINKIPNIFKELETLDYLLKYEDLDKEISDQEFDSEELRICEDIATNCDFSSYSIDDGSSYFTVTYNLYNPEIFKPCMKTVNNYLNKMSKISSFLKKELEKIENNN